MTKNNICKNAFKEAMRPISGDNVDLPQVDQNFEALGNAVDNILTQQAETISHKNQDDSFWQWVEAVNQYLSDLSQWQQDVNQVIQQWQPTQVAEQNMKTQLTQLSVSKNIPETPNFLKGKIQFKQNNQQEGKDSE